ncbi:ABC transporter permease subunit [Stappia sp.]|jgi:spermidine/putrescine transport system permease protein|uniref:ABC transporter permease subunit n=1 Tax=Stappia sp. TaxID=1870903 RepID=UPI003D0E5013
MASLIRSYGKGLTAVFLLLTAGWIALLIVLPQARLIERAFTYTDRAGEAATLSLEIDRAYTRVFEIDTDLRDLRSDLEGVSAPAGGAAGGLVPSPSLTPSLPSPSATPSLPAAPSLTPSLSPSPSPTPTPGVAPSPFAPSASPTLPPAQIEARIAELEAEKAELQTRLAGLEEEESSNNSAVGINETYSLQNFTNMSDIHFRIFVSTLFYALCVTVLAFVVCYPVAYAAATTKNANKLALLMLGLVIPYAINELLRIFSWVMILEKNGILNGVLDAIGLIDMQAGEGIRFVASNGAVFTVMVYAYVLFMVFPIYNTIETLDRNQIEAARDLGSATWRIHWRIVLPHAKPGIAVGAIMTFMLSAGSIAVPEIVGRGLHPDWFAQVIYRRFFEADSWNEGAAYSLALLIACIAFVLVNMAVFKVGIRDIAK